MTFTSKDGWLIKQANGVIWNFKYDEHLGIIYRILKDNEESFYEVLIDKCRENFSVCKFTNDNMCILYEDLNRKAMLLVYDGVKWIKSKILQQANIEKYEKQLEKQEKLLKEFQYDIEEEKMKCISYENQLKYANSKYDRFEEDKKVLREHINFLEKSLIGKEKRINELEKIIMEKNKKTTNSFFEQVFNNSY